MDRLFVMDLKNYDVNAPRFRRPSVRAIIIRDRKVAMVHSLKYDYYKFPGGGIEAGECYHEALIREVKEETGLIVIEDSITEFGSVLRLQRGIFPDEVFEQENLYYRCAVEDTIGVQDLDDYEAIEHFELEFVTLQEAIRVNRNSEHGPKDQLMIEREAKVLEMLLDCESHHTMKLSPGPFQKILSGSKTIELRLNDEKRQKIKVKDTITFVNTDNETKMLTARVLKLHCFSSFKKLYDSLPLLQCGYLEAEVTHAKPADMDAYYAREKQQQYGVVGIEITTIADAAPVAERKRTIAKNKDLS